MKLDDLSLSAVTALNDLAEELLREGRKEAAQEIFLVAAKVIGLARGLDRLTVKHGTVKLSTVEHSEKTRSDLSKRFGRKKDPNMDAARGAGIPSLRALAAKMGCSASFLSQVAAGDRPMPADKAEAFKKLTGKAWQ